MAAPTEFHVDLDALHANLAAARDLAGGRLVLAAVKANAYGHGLVAVARSIQERGSAEWLGVALTSEAQELRDAGVTLPILKFTPTLPDDLPDAIAVGVTVSVGEAGAIRAAQVAAADAGVTLEVHLKIDTGMRRVGAEPRDAVLLAHQLASSPNLNLTGIFTHLPISDVPDDNFTVRQLARFDDVVAAVEDVTGPIR